MKNRVVVRLSDGSVPVQEVIINDVRMPFTSMLRLATSFVFSATPALLLLWIAWNALQAFLHR